MTEMAMLWKNRVIGLSGNLKRKPQGQLPYARVYGRAPHYAEREPCAVGVGLTNRVWFSALKNSARNWRLPSSTHHRRTTVFENARSVRLPGAADDPQWRSSHKELFSRTRVSQNRLATTDAFRKTPTSCKSMKVAETGNSDSVTLGLLLASLESLFYQRMAIP